MTNFRQILEKYRDTSFSERHKGARFEALIAAFLRTSPEYAPIMADVWLWNDFPFRKDFGTGQDVGIDIVARTVSGEFWAVQCKCYAEGTRIDKPAVDGFLATSGKTFRDEEGRVTSFASRLWVSTTNHWGVQAELAIRNQDPPVSRLNLSDLEAAPVDWGKLEKGLSGEGARVPKKEPRPHQVEAIEAFHKHFKAHDRGKLIMACGTGKTFTALRIAEGETGGHGLVLFLAPSIALIGQTLREWMADASGPMYPVCVCSDPKVSRKKLDADDEDNPGGLVDLALPASTEPQVINQQVATYAKKGGLTVVFSTYQSIEVIAKAQKRFNLPFDLIVCDEAHRTTGVTLKGDDESAFVKIHHDDFIKAKKRLYMTATPRLYRDDVKAKAKAVDAFLCSMDDAETYGEEVYRLGFGKAVEQGLLSDYKVLVFTVNDPQIPGAIKKAVADGKEEIDSNIAAQLVGSINALSKRVVLDGGLVKESDPAPMHRAVAFCPKIAVSKLTRDIYNRFKDQFYEALSEKDRQEVVVINADHVDGTMSAPERDEKLAWLKAAPTVGQECRILTNVRCLSEGVDVPSLDAVIFLSARNSQIDVVQSVGRVMRVAPGKRFGYIIIPVLVPTEYSPNEVLDDNERYKVVWTVLNALRAHDDRFNAFVNAVEFNQAKANPDDLVKHGGGKVVITPGPAIEPDASGQQGAITIWLPNMAELCTQLYARMVQKVGDRLYWDQWAADVADIASRHIERITGLIGKKGPHKEAFDDFLKGLQKSINPAVTEGEVVEMLAQHMVTRPVFEAIFENYSFSKSNPVSQAMQRMVDLLEEQALDKDAKTLEKFYESVRRRVAGVTTTEGKQRVITELYDKFFRLAFKKMTERLGIVYTPVNVVDFINRSADAVLRKEFGRGLTDEGVHVIDPFTGTGTFIVRMLQSGLIEGKDMARKYAHELHANEIVLLAYYIAAINVENAYHEFQPEGAGYEPFPGICLTDTFQLMETDNLITKAFPVNSKRAQEQRKVPIQVIVGNPPYSVGQRNANNNAQNQHYPELERRLRETYVARTGATNKNALFDSYIKAFRWASDRLDKAHGGIVAFVSNGGWLDGNAMDGFRQCLEEEFSAVYVFNLRGNQRTSGEISKREGGKIFGSGSRAPIAITVLVKKPGATGKASIHYHDIGDYLTREEKLDKVTEFGHVLNPKMEWAVITPNEHGDWLYQRNDAFSSFIPLGDKDSKQNPQTVFASVYGRGLATCRDAWCYNFSNKALTANIKHTIGFFNSLVAAKARKAKLPDISGKDISMSRAFQNDLDAGKEKAFRHDAIRTAIYRPFYKNQCYFDRALNEMLYQTQRQFPTPDTDNLAICVSGIGVTKEFSCLVTNILPDLEFVGKSQCFPLYWYEPAERYQGNLFSQGGKYVRHDGVTDFILKRCREAYGPKVTREDIFYYVYGLLHSPDYRREFSADLKKMLPRLPLVERPMDFWAFSKAGRALGGLHLHYEDQPPCKAVKVSGDEQGNFKITKMRFVEKGDKSSIVYNGHITLSNIPARAYEYVVNGKSAIEWVMERYQITTNKDSGIVNDPNDWAKEQGQPRYILDLLLSVITVSLKTLDIVDGLPKMEFKA